MSSSLYPSGHFVASNKPFVAWVKPGPNNTESIALSGSQKAMDAINAKIMAEPDCRAYILDDYMLVVSWCGRWASIIPGLPHSHRPTYGMSTEDGRVTRVRLCLSNHYIRAAMLHWYVRFLTPKNPLEALAHVATLPVANYLQGQPRIVY